MNAMVLRYSGLVLAAGAVVLALAVIAISVRPVVAQIITPGVSFLLLLAALLLNVSLPGLYLKQGDAPRLGEIIQGKLSWSWLLLAGHLLLQAGLLVFVIIAAPALSYAGLRLQMNQGAAYALLGFFFFLGLVLSGVASFQAGVFPRWQSVVLIAAGAGFFLSFLVAGLLAATVAQVIAAFTGLLLAAALGGMGVFMWEPKYLTVGYWTGGV